MRTRSGDAGDARQRFELGTAYLEVAALADARSSRAAMQVAVGNYVLAAIAFADAVCLARLGRRSTDTDHGKAAQLLSTVDRPAADALRRLLAYKTQAHYGPVTMSLEDLKRSQRLAESLERLAAQAVRS